MNDPEIQERQRFAAPIGTLLLLSPFIAELLSGSARTSILFVYLPEVRCGEWAPVVPRLGSAMARGRHKPAAGDGPPGCARHAGAP